MKNTIYRTVLSILILGFSCMTFASECKKGKRTIAQWVEHDGTFKELALPKKMIESKACFRKPGEVTEKNASMSEVAEYSSKWKKENNIRNPSGWQLVELIETLALQFDLSLEQFCYDPKTRQRTNCEEWHSVQVSFVHNAGENKTRAQKLTVGKFATDYSQVIK